PAALLAAAPGAALTASAAALAGRAARAALGGAACPHVLALTEKGLPSVLPIKTKLGAALALATGLIAHQALTAQQPSGIQRPPAGLDQDTRGGGWGLPAPPGGAAPAADLDRHLA